MGKAKIMDSPASQGLIYINHYYIPYRPIREEGQSIRRLYRKQNSPDLGRQKCTHILKPRKWSKFILKKWNRIV